MIITSILEKYYSISTLAVYWTSMIYMVLYIPLIFPASWLLDKKVKTPGSQTNHLTIDWFLKPFWLLQNQLNLQEAKILIVFRV